MCIYIYIYIYIYICIYVYTYNKNTHTGVCEMNTHLDGAGVFNVPTPLPVFQS